MVMHQDDARRHHSSTYFAERSNQDEMARLAIQDGLITQGMGGVLPEQPDPAAFKRVLDIGCGTGSWLIGTAKTYPLMTQLVGVDVNSRLVEYARTQAEAEQVQDRVEFQVMDALLVLEFPDNYFDLTNVRFATGYMRTWNWPKLLNELQRVTRPGGIVRVTEVECVHSNTSASLRLLGLMGEAFYNAGHLFVKSEIGETSARGTIGVAAQLEGLLRQHGLRDVQTHRSELEFAAGTPAGQSYHEDAKLVCRTIVPFLRKWTHFPDDYEELYQQMVRDGDRPDHLASWDLITAWGKVPL